jgi:hypothetical protein
MERDGLIAHGLSSFLEDSMMKRGDEYKVAICNQSGTIAIYNKVMDNFYSPMVDGPITFDLENSTTPSLITKYGKDFSIVRIPYSFKLLIQELTAMNVQMRLITADNIDQLTSMSKRTLTEIVNIDVPKTKNRSVKNRVTNEDRLSQLEAKMQEVNEQYVAKFNEIRKKYQTNKAPNGSQDKLELDRLKDQYETTREEFYTLSNIVNKEKISSIKRELDSLQFDYDEYLKAPNDSKMSAIRLQYQKKMSEYSDLVGEDYQALRLTPLVVVPNVEKLNQVVASLRSNPNRTALQERQLNQAENDLALLEDVPYVPEEFPEPTNSPPYTVPNESPNTKNTTLIVNKLGSEQESANSNDSSVYHVPTSDSEKESSNSNES